MNSGFRVKAAERETLSKWLAGLGAAGPGGVAIVSWRQGWGKLKLGCSIANEKLCLAGKRFDHGLGTHADSEIVLRSARPLKTFRATAGIDLNRHSAKSAAEIRFSVSTAGVSRWNSAYLKVGDEPAAVAVELDGALEFTLNATAKDGIAQAHIDWADAEVVTLDGQVLLIGERASVCAAAFMPVSFKYNGLDAEAWFRKYGVTQTQAAGPNYTTHRLSCQDPDTGLQCVVDVQEYVNSPACLWNVYFTNTGKKPTPILEQVNALDLNGPGAGRKTLHRARGAFHYETGDIPSGEDFRDDFMMVQDNLESPVVMGGAGGRSSVDWMPYFNFQGEREGLMFGIGWTGQWHAEIRCDNDRIRFQAGMERLHTILEPGETIRQPAILMIYWQGDQAIRGHNLLRHFILENLAPRANGAPLPAPACNLTWGGMTAASHLERIKNLAQEKLAFDYYWIDAGWYGKAGPSMDEFSPGWGGQAGDWSINRDTFPHGLTEVSDAVHAAGKKFLLWCEPERAVYGTPMTLEHPEWFLGVRQPGASLLLNLGHPEARKWCTELIAGLIAAQGVDCYRQDFNLSPLPFWQAADTPERLGISEIRYVEGLYAFLGELRQRFPQLLIDNCASGGRRLDFEMMRYSLPLWGSDMQCYPGYVTERNQQQVQGLSYWLPQFAFGTQDHAGDTYHFRSTMAAGLCVHLFTYERDPIKPDYPYPWLRERLAEYHRAKAYFSGDFYPLCDQTGSMKYWTAYQFHRPDLDSGLLLFFRKRESDIEKMCFPLRELAASAYDFEDADSQRVVTLSRQELAATGVSVELANRRESRLIFYRRKL